MMKEMSLKHQILKGTFVLAGAGIITRFLGLYNRVFLANAIGAAELGVYQLIFPVFMVCNAVCCAGIEIALSRLVANYNAKGNYGSIKRLVKMAVGFSLGISLLLGMLVYIFADPISCYILKEPLSEPCLRFLAPVIVFSTAHSCILGYFYGIKNTTVPSISLLLEQMSRVGSIYIFVNYFSHVIVADARLAVLGMVFGDGISCIFTLTAYVVYSRKKQKEMVILPRKKLFGELISDAAPLTLNRLSLNVLQSIEAILMPAMMKLYYTGEGQALEIYGVITGMTMPFIMFPATVTNALASVLLPTVAQAHAGHKFNTIRQAVSKSLHYCLLMGILCLGVFYLYGQYVGEIVFKNTLSGELLGVFSILCPFIYTSSVLSSSLNGLGKMHLILFHNLLSVGIRMLFVVVLVPKVGIFGYLAGTLLASFILLLMHGISIAKVCGISVSVMKSMILPLIGIGISGFVSLGCFRWMTEVINMPLLVAVILAGSICSGIYAVVLMIFGCSKA